MKRKTKLNTEKLSIAATQALEDLEACEKDDRYRIYMGQWHRPASLSPPQCEVCFAGAVMAKRLGADVKLDLTSAHYDDNLTVSRMLDALDCLRMGSMNLLAARGFLGDYTEEDFASATLVTLQLNRGYEGLPKWKTAMRRMIKMLERRGL